MVLLRRDLGAAYRLAICIMKPVLIMLGPRRWRGREHVPPEGGVILAANHLSHLDVFPLAEFLFYSVRRVPRFLAKDSLWRVPFVGWVCRDSQQVPVKRGTREAAHALDAAVEAIGRGEVVVIYPEGTLTHDPDVWPMLGRTGTARLALLTGVPVVPVAQWGIQEVMSPDKSVPVRQRVRLRRVRLQVAAGPPVDLSRWQGQPPTAQVLREMTTEIMRAITVLLAELRGEAAPALTWDPRSGGRVDDAALPETG